jgi:hypothetical protein
MGRILFIVLAVFTLTGCTSEDIYDQIQLNQQNKCESLPYPQRDDCLRHVSTDYEDYERERKKLRKTDK